MIEKNTVVNTPKDFNFDMSIFSDIHADKNTDYTILDKYVKKIYNKLPKFVVFLGDALNDGNDMESAKRISDYFYKICKVCPLVMILGNHDKVTFKNDKWIYIRSKEDMEKYNDIIKLYKSIPNLNFLSNSSTTINNVRFYGLDPDIKFYIDDNFFEDDKLKLLYQYPNYFNIYDYNVVLAHSPIYVMDNDVIKNETFYNNTDLILSGHMHNGLLPLYMEWMVPGNKGLVGKKQRQPYLFPELSKGSMPLVNDITGVIANPVCTFSTDKGTLSKLNGLYPVPYQNIKIRRKKRIGILPEIVKNNLQLCSNNQSDIGYAFPKEDTKIRKRIK